MISTKTVMNNVFETQSPIKTRNMKCVNKFTKPMPF